MKQNSFSVIIIRALIGVAFLLNAPRIIAQNPFPATAVTLFTSTSAYATSPLNAFATNNCTTGSQDLRGQCTWYVNARLQELKASGHLVVGTVNSIQTALCNATGRHAKNWDNIIGGTWYSTSTSALPLAQRNPGMIVVWDNDPNNGNSTLYGHVGFVEEISADKTMYRVSEFNWCNNNCRLYNGGSTWLPFDGNDSRLGVYPKFYAVGLNTTATPVTNAPTGTNIQIPVNFSWGSVAGTSVEYRIQVSTTNSGWTAQNGFNSSTSCGSTLVVNRNTGSSSSFSWSAITTGVCFAPQPGTTYYWTVKAYSPAGGNSAYSAVKTFTTASSSSTVTTPTAVNASDGSYSDRVNITYSGTSGNYFRVYRNTSNNSSTATALGSWQTSTTYDDYTAVAGTTYFYWVRAASNSSGSNISAYSVANTGYRAATPTAPANDNPCSATTIVAGSGCSYTTGTTVGATNTTNPAAPTSCPFYGKDVWFKVQVPSSGIVTIRTNAGSLNDLVMAIYYGSCSSLQGIVCEDDNTNGNNSAMPVITVTGYAAGTWLHIRAWGYGGATGTFSICALNYSIASLTAPETGVIPEQEPLLNIFPNPSDGDLSLQYVLATPSTVQVEVFDLTGKLVFASSEEQAYAGSFTQSMNLRSLPGGAYFLKAKINDRVFTEKILLTRP